MRLTSVRFLLLFTVAVLMAVPPAVAQDDAAKKKNWRYELAPYYLWMAGLEGDVALKGQPAEVDLSFSDVLDDLEFMFSAHFEAHHRNGWGYLFEPLFLDLESSAMGLTGDIIVDTDLLIVEGMIINQLADPGSSFELIWGARYYNLELEFDFPLAVAPNIEEDQSWVDGVVGVRWMTDAGKKWTFSLRGDVGAGGSDFVWQFSGLAIWQMSKKTSLAFGYRHLDIDYEDGAGTDLFVMDVALSGPIVGLNISW